MLKRKSYLISKGFEATIIFIVFILLFVFKLNASPAPSTIFSNGMVIQKKQQIHAGGLYPPDEHIEITDSTTNYIGNKVIYKHICSE